MAIRILVPLDGSPLAECALAEAAALGTALARVTIDEFLDLKRAHAVVYLNRVRQRPQWKGIAPTVAVETGPPAETILDFCRTHQIDKIVMATHGRTGITRWVYGSVADKV